MNVPPLRWSYRYAAYAATLGALVGFAWVAAQPPAFVVPRGSRLGTSDDAVPSMRAAASTSQTTRTGRTRQGETVSVVIPRYDGTFMMTVSNAPVQLSTPVLSPDRKTLQSTGQLGVMTVTDYRFQSQPGWSIFGQVSDFSGGGPTFSGGFLGWTPWVTASNEDNDVTAGPPLIPGPNRGLKGGSVMAAAPAPRGIGITVLAATLYLEVPASTPVRSQAATLTLTLLERA